MKREPTILANRIRTPDGTILQSYNRHDFKTYTDKNGKTYGVDGGCEYLRRIGTIGEDISVYSDDPHELIREAMCWGTRGVNGDEPLRYIPLMEMTTEHIEACLETQKFMHPAFRVAMENELAFRKQNS